MSHEVAKKHDFFGRVKVISNDDDIIFHRIRMIDGEERTQVIFEGLFEIKSWMPRRSELVKGTCKIWDLTEKEARPLKHNVNLIAKGSIFDETFVCDDGAKRHHRTLYMHDVGISLRDTD